MKTQTAKVLTALATLLAAISTQAQYAYITLDHPLGVQGTYAQGISGTSIVGYYVATNNTHGFLYNGSTWTTLDHPLGVNGTFAQGISGTNIVGYYMDTNNVAHGFLYNGNVWTTLDDPNSQTGNVGTFAQAISGTNTVGYCGAHGFLYNGSGWTTLDDPAYRVTQAQGVDGTNIVGSSYPNNGVSSDGWPWQGFLYNGSTWTGLVEVLPFPWGGLVEVSTFAFGIDGTNVVGSYLDFATYPHGFIYNGSTYTTLNHPLGVSGSVARGISGVNIVGNYLDANNIPHGFLATLIPQLTISLSSSSLRISWPSSATNFVLQQNFDLSSTNWVNAPELPILNTSNMQYEVTLNPAFVLQNSHYNFRLKQQ